MLRYGIDITANNIQVYRVYLSFRDNLHYTNYSKICLSTVYSCRTDNGFCEIIASVMTTQKKDALRKGPSK